MDIELKKEHNPVSPWHYPFTIINRGTFRKYLEGLVEIGVPTSAQSSQYGTPVLIKLKK